MRRDLVPHDLEAERAVIMALMRGGEGGGFCDEILAASEPGYFYHPLHVRIYNAATRLRERGAPVDLVTVHQEMAASGEVKGDEAADVASIYMDRDELIASVNWPHYLAIVRDCWRRRELIAAAMGLLQSAQDRSRDVGDVLDECEQRVFALATTGASGARDVVHCQDAVRAAVDHIEKVYRSRGKTVGLSTGIHDWDRMTSGLMGGQMITIAARPSRGKSALGMQVAVHVAQNEGVPVLVFSIEMPSEDLMVRQICARARVDLQRMRDGFLSKNDVQEITQAASELAKARIYLDDTPGLTVAQFRSRSRLARAKWGVGLILVDYLQFMHGSSKRSNESRALEVSEISAAIKGVAKELNVPVIALCQLNRTAEDAARPKLAHLRESGSIEQDSDMVVLIHQLQEKEREEMDYNCELILAKQRNGPTGSIKMIFEREFTTFRNLTAKVYSNRREERQR